MHSGFDYWLEDPEAADEAHPQPRWSGPTRSLRPTARLAAVEAAYWMQLGERRQLRWVLPEDEGDVGRRAGPAAGRSGGSAG